MTTFEVTLESDHLERIAQGRRPTLVLAELIWSSLDADAKHVSVVFERVAFGLDAMVATDHGTGISELDASDGFTKLGGAWKRLNTLTRRDPHHAPMVERQTRLRWRADRALGDGEGGAIRRRLP